MKAVGFQNSILKGTGDGCVKTFAGSRVWQGGLRALICGAGLAAMAALVGCDGETYKKAEEDRPLKKSVSSGDAGAFSGDAIVFGEHSATGMPKDLQSWIGGNTPIPGATGSVAEVKSGLDTNNAAYIYYALYG